MKKRVLSVFLVLCFVLTLLPAAFADSSTSGACGDNLTWTLDGDGTLTISGTGKMWGSACRAKTTSSLTNPTRQQSRCSVRSTTHWLTIRPSWKS